MRGLLKFFGILIGLLALLIVAAALLLPRIIDPNQYKDQIIAQVMEQTGRQLEINQDIGISVFPWIGAELGGLRLHNPEGFEQGPFMAVEQVSVKVKLLPLISKRLEVSRIVLDGAQINLRVNEDGRTNWEDLAGGESASAEETAPDSASGDEDGGPPPLEDLRINGLEITNARLSWQDATTGQSAEIKDLEITTGEIRLGEPVELKVRLSASNQNPQADATLEFSTTADFSPETNRLTLQQLVLELQASGDAVGGQADLHLEANVDARLAATPLIDVKGLTLTANLDRPDLKVQSRLSGDLLSDESAGVIRASPLTLEAELQGDALPAKDPLQLNLTAHLEAALDGSRATLEQIVLALDPMQLNGSLSVTGLNESPNFTGHFEIPAVDLRQLTEKLGVALPPTTDPDVLKSFQANIDIAGSQAQDGLHLKAEPFTAVLDDTHLKGQAKIEGAHIGFDLEIDGIDADRYLPPAGAETASAADDSTAAQNDAGAAGELIPMEPLRALDLAGVIRIGQFKVANVRMSEIRFDVLAKDGTLRLDKKIGSFYQGGLEGSVGLDVQGKEPKIKVTEKLKRFQVGPLLADATGEDTLLGTALFNADLNTAGNSIQGLKAGLNGDLNFRFENGAVKGFNLGQFLRQAKAAFRGETVQQAEGPVQTDFTELSGSAKITNGVLVNRDLSAKSPLLRVDGDGSVNLVNETLDYTVTALVVNTSTGQGGKDLQQLIGIPIPIRLSGPLAGPDFAINWEKVLTEAVKEKAKEKAQEAIEKKLMEKLGGSGSSGKSGSGANPLEGALRGLFR